MLVLAGLLAWSGAPSPGHAAATQPSSTGGSYRLGPEDKIRLKVFEWRPAADVVFEWKALNDEFTVSADGILSIPLAGQIAAAGLTPDAVASLIGQQLRTRLNLSAPPDASVDIVQYRPFFVAGDVTHPGPYPFRPGLTVLEAVTIAGGINTAGGAGLLRFDRDIIAQEGELIQLGRDYQALLIRRARLRAEVNGQDNFDVPAELAKAARSDFVTGMMKAETTIFEARSRAFLAQTQALAELKAFLIKEGEALDGQLVTIDTQVGLINKELTSVASLVEKGMAVAPRQLALERSVAQIQGDRLSMQTNKLRVQEETSKTDLSIIELRSSRVTEASIELRDTEVKIDGVLNRTATAGKLLFDSKVTAPHLLAEYLENSHSAPRFALVRTVDGQATATDVTEDTRVEPGDTIKVLLPVPPAGSALTGPTDDRSGGRPVRESSASP
jgi:protein involved in polysaccharide export with SLBB domain